MNQGINKSSVEKVRLPGDEVSNDIRPRVLLKDASVVGPILVTMKPLIRRVVNKALVGSLLDSIAQAEGIFLQGVNKQSDVDKAGRT